jgi:glutathione S-transferase
MPSTRFAGKLAGLYPSDPFQALLCDEVMYVVEEAGAKLGPTFRMTGDEQKAARLALVNGSMPVYLRWLQSQLQAHGGEYFADQPPDGGRPEGVCGHARPQRGPAGPCA